MTEPEPIYMSRLSWQEAIQLQQQEIGGIENREHVQGLRRHLIGALMACDMILFGDPNYTVDIDKK